MRVLDWVLVATLLVFGVAAPLQFVKNLSAAERGLVLFEKSCPIHTAPGRTL